MMRSASILLAAIGLVGCAAPRYQVAVTSVPSSVGRADWAAVRVNQQTGTSWYLRDDGSGRHLKWQRILEGDETTKK